MVPVSESILFGSAGIPAGWGWGLGFVTVFSVF